MNRVRVGTLLGVWLLAALLAACGTPAYPPNAFHQCGTVHEAAGRILPQGATAASAAEDCFAHNYTNCQASTLVFTDMGVDTGTTRTFAESQISGTCTVRDNVQGYTANGGGSTFPAHTYTCSGLSQQPDGLHITACGQDGDVLVPAPAAE